MDKKDILLININIALNNYKQRYKETPISIISGFKPLNKYTIQDVPVIYDDTKEPMEFEIY